MSGPKNYLQIHRKRSHLTQADIAFIMEVNDCSNLSRCEKGQRAPNHDMLLVYHILFDTPMEAFFQSHRKNLKSKIIERIELLIIEVGPVTSSKGRSKLEFLKETLTRLTTPHHEQP